MSRRGQPRAAKGSGGRMLLDIFLLVHPAVE